MRTQQQEITEMLKQIKTNSWTPVGPTRVRASGINRLTTKKVRGKSREYHNYKAQPISETKRKGKQTKPNKRKAQTYNEGKNRTQQKQHVEIPLLSNNTTEY